MISRVNRRQAIAAIGGLIGGGLALAANPRPALATDVPASWLTGGRDTSGSHGLYRVTADGRHRLIWQTALRLHAPMVHPKTGDLVAVARSVGDKIFFGRGDDMRSVRAAEGRHFYGHGAFSERGDALFVGENDFDRVRGVISVRDPNQAYKTVDEFPSGGLGPHEVMWHQGRIIAANGGLEKHPDTGRQVLNLQTMQSNAAVIDPKDGSVQRRITLTEDHRFLSLRHMAAHGHHLYLGVQDQARENPDRPLVFQADIVGKSDPKPMTAPREGWSGFRGYIGSVAIDRSGQWVAATSPRGGRLAIWPTVGGIAPEVFRLDDVCGVAPGLRPGLFIATTGHGTTLRIDMTEGATMTSLAVDGPIVWDNHLTPA